MKKKDRDLVFNKFGGRCAYCGCELQKGWHLDHMEPVQRIYKDEWIERKAIGFNGEPFMRKEIISRYKGMVNAHLDTVENAMPACAKCNINKHGDSIEGFRSSISGYLNSLNQRMVQYQMAKKYGLVEETGKKVLFYFETLYNRPNNHEKDITPEG